jgi:hypothetical protein
MAVFHLGFQYVWMFHKEALNLFRENFVSNPDNYILTSSDYSSISVFPQHDLVSVYKQSILLKR